MVLSAKLARNVYVLCEVWLGNQRRLEHIYRGLIRSDTGLCANVQNI